MSLTPAPDPSGWFNGLFVSAASILANLTNYINSAITAINSLIATSGPMASGTATVTITTANTDFNVAVTFPTGRFTSTPALALTAQSSDSSSTTVSYMSLTSTGFVLHCKRTTATNAVVSWIAVAAP